MIMNANSHKISCCCSEQRGSAGFCSQKTGLADAQHMRQLNGNISADIRLIRTDVNFSLHVM